MLVRETIPTLGEGLSMSHMDYDRSLLPFIHITDRDSRIKFNWLHLMMLIGEQQIQIAATDSQEVAVRYRLTYCIYSIQTA